MKHEMESMRTLLETKNKDHIETKKKVNEVIEWNRDQLDQLENLFKHNEVSMNMKITQIETTLAGAKLKES